MITNISPGSTVLLVEHNSYIQTCIVVVGIQDFENHTFIIPSTTVSICIIILLLANFAYCFFLLYSFLKKSFKKKNAFIIKNK